jgi:hypothetical protein
MRGSTVVLEETMFHSCVQDFHLSKQQRIYGHCPERMTHRQVEARQTDWKGDALKPDTRIVRRPVLLHNGREGPSPGTHGHHASTAAAAAAAAAAGQKIIRLEVVWRISSEFHKPALIREVLHGFSSFLILATPTPPPRSISYLTPRSRQ